LYVNPLAPELFLTQERANGKAVELTRRLRRSASARFIQDTLEPRAGSGTPQEPSDCVVVYPVMKPIPIISEKKASIAIWIGAMLFGH
jgi:hypothetical protein